MKALRLILIVTTLAIALSLSVAAYAQPDDLIPVRFAAIEGASQSYVPRLIEELGIDAKYGLDITIFPLTATGQQWTGLRAGEFDIATGSFLDLLRQRDGGLDARAVRGFLTFSSPIVTTPDSEYTDLQSLAGTRVGTPNTTLLDWLIIRAAGVEIADFDIEAEAEVVNSSPPLIAELLQTGELDAALQFSSQAFGPLEAGELRKITDIPTLLADAGFDPESFYLTYNVSGAFAEQYPEAVPALVAAIDEAIETLLTDDSVWPRLAASSGVEDEEVLPAFIAGERLAFTTVFSPEKLEASQALIDSIAAVVGEEVVGVTEVDPEAFNFEAYEAGIALRQE
jgi:NitT/TauT family transport system substrate-binding protein